MLLDSIRPVACLGKCFHRFSVRERDQLLHTNVTVFNRGERDVQENSGCSLCLQYSSTEEAAATRTALHGVKWPQSNPKFLSVDFAEQDEVRLVFLMIPFFFYPSTILQCLTALISSRLTFLRNVKRSLVKIKACGSGYLAPVVFGAAFFFCKIPEAD